MRDAADKLESALGHEVKVRPRGGEIAVEIRFEDLDEALALARSLERAGAEPAAFRPVFPRYPSAWLRAISSVG